MTSADATSPFSLPTSESIFLEMDVDTTITVPTSQKHDERRQRNRESAKKSRERAKKWEAYLQSELKKEKALNEQMKQTIQNLQTQIETLKMRLQKSENFSCETENVLK